MGLYLLLKSSLSLMTRGWNIIRGYTCLWTDISICKLILHIGNLLILSWTRHDLTLWAKLLAYMQTIFNDWSSVRFLITDHAIWLSIAWFAVSISSLSDVLEFSLVTSHRMINCSVRLLVLPIPFVLRGSHIVTLEAFSNCLRLPFLSHLLSTRILNVSGRKLNGILVSCWSWVSLCLHLPDHVRVNSCRGIFNVLLSVVCILIIFHWYD